MKTTEKPKMIPKFIVYKKGVTDKPVTICQLDGEPFDEDSKRKKFLWLGYTITEVNG